ncbi:thermonuclease family protein [Archangium violaceum]|uniref:thermonuclease family protein n=1 Tax=Archangium violaceum TaxID=83451 RepID=UPI0019506C4D|nr:thermonuclease family protein [Archangium violaceum]QRN96383.1 thermonuclease family protein [Archangium violaceum]
MRAVNGWRVLVVVLGCVLIVLCACGSESACGPSAGVVSRVVDGDTVVLQSGERVRYLLVDTPESTGGKHECFGAESRDFNRSLVEGRVVRLRYGEACTDRYGRLLAYVSVDGHEVNALLAEQGYACVLYIAPAGESRRSEFQSLESSARRAGRGMWGECSAVPCEK